ncbi:MAG: Gfo/Idh/MocA family oxidoreductase [Bacteroidales bacterium]
MRPVKTALASFGMSGMVFHAPLLHMNDGFEISKILERSRNSSKSKYPYARIVRDFEDLCLDDSLELIIVNTPDHTHYELAKAALNAGKHVVVEKPFTLKYSHAAELEELASKKDLLISVFQNRRWDGDFLTVKRVIDQKLLGRLVEFESHFDRFRNYIQPATWKEDASTGTGTLYNLGSHMIDQALLLFGKPRRVTADIRIFRSGGSVDDSFEVWMGYDDIKVTVCGSYLVREAGPRYCLHGTEGSFLKWGLDPQEKALKSGIMPGGNRWGCEDENDWGIINTTVGNGQLRGRYETVPGNYQAYYDNIYSVLREGKEPEVPARQASLVVKVIEAAFMSQKTGKSVSL